VVTDLGTFPGDTSSAALGINDFGAIVGISAQAPTDFFEPPSEEFNCPCHAALWTNGQVVDLNTLIPANSGWQLTIAIAINDRGQIIGQGTFNNNPRSFLLTPIRGLTSGLPASASAESLTSGGAQASVAQVIRHRGETRFVMQVGGSTGKP